MNEMTGKYILLFLIGHLLGDFYFQTEKLARWKEKSYAGVIVHSLEYLPAMMLPVLPVVSRDLALAAVCAAGLHFVIDSVKFLILKSGVKDDCRVFVADQCAHVISIAVLSYFMSGRTVAVGHYALVRDIWKETGLQTGLQAETAARWLLAILMVHTPANIFIQKFIGSHRPAEPADPAENGLIVRRNRQAGKKIGTIERLIMLIFLSVNQFAAIGFVLTAKSIARYDRIAKEKEFAEYYLLGTLVSTLYVIVCRMLILP